RSPSPATSTLSCVSPWKNWSLPCGCERTASARDPRYVPLKDGAVIRLNHPEVLSFRRCEDVEARAAGERERAFAVGVQCVRARAARRRPSDDAIDAACRGGYGQCLVAI